MTTIPVDEITKTEVLATCKEFLTDLVEGDLSNCSPDELKAKVAAGIEEAEAENDEIRLNLLIGMQKTLEQNFPVLQ